MWAVAAGIAGAAALALVLWLPQAPGTSGAAAQQTTAPQQQQNDTPAPERRRGGGAGGAAVDKATGGEAGKDRKRKRGRRGRPTFVELDAVSNVPLTQTVPVLGRMVARQAGVVAARISGPVSSVAVHVGDRVKTGDVVAVLVSNSLHWQRELRAGEVAEYKGALSSAKAKLSKAQDELRRIRNLRKSAAFSQARLEVQQREVENLEGEVAKASAELSQTRANMKLAEINLNNARILAPYPGVVTKLHTVAGAYLNVGAPVVALVNDTDLEIEADVPSTRLGGLPVGAVLDIELEDKSRHKAAVRAVVPDENPLARTRAVRLTPSFQPYANVIAANQTVVLHVPIGASRTVLSVHKDAVVQRGGGAAIYVVEENQAQLRRVRLGEAVGSRFELLEGAKAGDLVVVRGNERLRPGQRVRVRGGGGGE